MKHVFKNTTTDDLSKHYDDFFLSKADDIADQLKTAPGVNDFEAHQMVCDMVQVSNTPPMYTYMYTVHVHVYMYTYYIYLYMYRELPPMIGL